jgi:hypothetical protein
MHWAPLTSTLESMFKQRLIAVLPKNYRSVALAAIEAASVPVVLLENQAISDFSERGPLTQRGIRECRNFEVRDGNKPILGFHDHPREMWIAVEYEALANRCAAEGWLEVQRNAS